MFTDLREINRVLLAMSEISINGVAKTANVINECKNIVLGGKIPSHEETIAFCIQSGIIVESNGLLRFSQLGKKLLQTNPDRLWDLNEQQKTLLIEKCLLDGYYKEKTLAILKRFLPDNKRQTFVFSKKDKFVFDTNLNDLMLLLQAGLILEDERLMFVNNDFSRYVSFLLNERKMSYDELEQKIKIDKEVGDIAEKIVLEYEKNRLTNKELAQAESSLVQIISGTDVAAGYDIESFDGKTADLAFDRFIEVKGSTERNISFFLSINEINKARELGSKYWIYFVPKINIRLGSHQGDIIKIQDPTVNILDNDKYKKECVKTRVFQQ
ncbi:MAG: DUF3883 domain-containing protein [Thaumarchaeota archaeon]|nr:DUF3883 domain-containing protein [Nitrososphaerota archaeon]